MNPRDLILYVIATATTLGLVYLAPRGLPFMAGGLAVAIGLLLLVYFGPDKLGIGLLYAGMLLTPQNDIRPTGSHQFAWNDIFLVLAFGLLLPRILEHRAKVPFLFAGGALVLTVMSVATSMLQVFWFDSLWWGLHLIAAGVVLPVVFVFLGATERERVRMAAFFVAGQVMSTVVAIIEGTDGSGRYSGTTFHPNYMGFGAIMAVSLVPYLYDHARTQVWRFAALSAAGMCAVSIWLSGSRGGLLALAMLVVLYPLMERSAISAYALFAGAIAAIPLLGLIYDTVDESSALGRLLGKDHSASASDDVRKEKLHEGWDRFLAHPVFGSGYSENLELHNVVLQVVVAVGLIGLVGWLCMLAACALPLFSAQPDRKLGYASIAYLAINMTEPGLWDRVGWVPLSLALLAGAAAYDSGRQKLERPARSVTA